MSLLEQLRRGVDTNEPPDKTDHIMTEAADEIARLQAELDNGDAVLGQYVLENQKLQAVLKEFADTQNPSIPLWISMKARKALAKERRLR